MRDTIWVVGALLIAAMLIVGLAVRDTVRDLSKQPRTTTTERARVIWITAHDDDRDHAVTDDEAVAGYTTGRGTYRAVCDTTFRPAPMEQPPYPPCLFCLSTLQPDRQPRAITRQA